MPSHERIVDLFLSVLNAIGEAGRHMGDKFSGLGLVLYDSQFEAAICHADLRPSIACPTGISLSNDSAVEFMVRISRKSDTCHDGFHFFNELGQLTHICQYLGSPIVPSVKPCESHGARHLSGQYAAHMTGVIAVGIVSTSGEVFCFSKGRTTV
jgi:hypothetical protein